MAEVGRVLDDKVGDGVTTKPFYPGSLCADAFGPDSKLDPSPFTLALTLTSTLTST